MCSKRNRTVLLLQKGSIYIPINIFNMCMSLCVGLCTLHAVTSHRVQSEFRTFYFAYKQAGKQVKKKMCTSKHRLHFVEFRFTGVPVNFNIPFRYSNFFLSFKWWVNPKQNPTHATDMVQLNDTMAQCNPTSIKYTLSCFNKKRTCCCIKLSNDKDSVCFTLSLCVCFYTLFVSGM